jgi:hypothetical protein
MHFSGPILLGRSEERRFSCAVASREVAVEYDVVLGHTPSGESSHEFRSHSLAGQLIQARNGGDGAGFVVDAVESDNREAASHSLDHHKSKRFRTDDRHEQSNRAGQKAGFWASEISPTISTPPSPSIGRMTVSK